MAGINHERHEKHKDFLIFLSLRDPLNFRVEAISTHLTLSRRARREKFLLYGGCFTAKNRFAMSLSNKWANESIPSPYETSAFYAARRNNWRVWIWNPPYYLYPWLLQIFTPSLTIAMMVSSPLKPIEISSKTCKASTQ